MIATQTPRLGLRRPLIQVARELGKHLATMHRWRVSGVNDPGGVRQHLPMTRVGGRCTSATKTWRHSSPSWRPTGPIPQPHRVASPPDPAPTSSPPENSTLSASNKKYPGVQPPGRLDVILLAPNRPLSRRDRRLSSLERDNAHDP